MIWRFCFSLVTALLLSGVARGTVVIEKSFQQLCVEADFIFIGTVDRTRSQWSDESRSSIETVVHFSAIEMIHGAERTEVELRFSGGEMDGIGEQIAGMPRFTTGERVVVFSRAGIAMSPIVGFNQGLFSVHTDETGEHVVTRSIPIPGTGAGGAGTSAQISTSAFADLVRGERKRLERTP